MRKVPIDASARYQADQAIMDDPAQDEAARQAAQIRQAFWRARFKKPQAGESFIPDEFVKIWIILNIFGQNSRTWGWKQKIKREMARFFEAPLLQAAIRLAGDAANAFLEEELTDSARTYYEACRSDRHFGSLFYGLIPMKDPEIARKAARETVTGTIKTLIMSGRPPWSDQIIRAAWRAYPEVFPEHSDQLAELTSQLDADLRPIVLDITGD